MSFYIRFGKPICDRFAAVAALLLLSPVLALLVLLVRLKLGSPVLFRQQRPGLHGQPFTILKFRTLANARDEHGRPRPDAERMTGLGRFLRQASLDELPELFNVLQGDMSLVGPRPLLMQYLNRYNPDQMRRLEVRPGITGWAQINGRNGVSWDERFKLDVWYVDHRSLWLDLKIILLTAWKVIRREGISQPGHVTMSEFNGSPNGDTPAAASPAAGVEPEAPGYTPEFKAQVVLEVLSGVKSAVQACQEYRLNPFVLARWQADFLENAARAFRPES